MNSKYSTTFLYVDNNSKLKQLIKKIKKAKRVAVDTEADSFHHYYEKICLIQLTVDGNNYIIDTLAEIDLSKCMRILAKKELIFHDAGYDLLMMRKSFGFRPRNKIFDTMLAAQLLGIEHFGLAALLMNILHVTITKMYQRADWSKRPLPPEMLSYAVDDTRYTESLAEKLLEKLDQLGRTEWHRQWCRKIVEASAREIPLQNPVNAWRIKGSKLLEPEQMAFVREIWFWRENEAKRMDVPSFRVMGNKQLLNLALWACDHKNTSLGNGPKLPANCRGYRFEALEEAIHKAAAMPKSDWPRRLEPRRRNSKLPEFGCKVLIERMREECASTAGKLKINPPVLATRSALTAIAYKRPETIKGIIESGSMMQWQAELLEPVLVPLVLEFKNQS